ncbi:MAG: site-specific integrase [Lachnospiraceae bacterium]
MSRKGENIYKRKDGRWEARTCVEQPGECRKYRYFYGKTYREAKEKRQAYLCNPGEHGRKRLSDKEKVLFSDCANEWKTEQKERVKASTYMTYMRQMEKHLLPVFGERQVRQITTKEIKAFFRELQQNGRCDGKGGLSAKTLSDLFIVLHHILVFASEKYGVLNPLQNCRKSDIIGNTLPLSKPGNNSEQALSEEECRKLTVYLFSVGTPEALGMLCSLYMGLRLGETCALRWEDINLEQQSIHIRHTLYRVFAGDGNVKGIRYLGEKRKTELVLSTPKTACSEREIPIPQFLLPLFLKHRAEPEVYLLTGTLHCMDFRTHQNHMKRVAAQCGIRNIHYHILRHTFASNCVALGVDVKTLSELLGHANTTITLNRYVHSSLYLKQVQMNKLSEAARKTVEEVVE